MSNYGTVRNVSVNLSRNDIYVVAYELLRLSEKYKNKALKLCAKGKCPSDNPIIADATLNVANEFIRVYKDLDLTISKELKEKKQ